MITVIKDDTYMYKQTKLNYFLIGNDFHFNSASNIFTDAAGGKSLYQLAGRIICAHGSICALPLRLPSQARRTVTKIRPSRGELAASAR